MYSTLISAVSTVLLATSTLAAALEPRNTTTCSPHNLGSVKNVSISTNASGKYSWVAQTYDNGRAYNIQVGSSDVANNTNTVGLTTQNGSTTGYRFQSSVFNGVQHCLSAFSEYEIRSAPCESELAAWTITCRSCGSDGSGKTCSIKNSYFGTCALIEPSYSKVDPAVGFVGLDTCAELGTGDGSTEANNQIWFFDPK
ncbi:hypothetical protein JCM11491_000912 [Sporobolomyces phaffii]